MPTRTDPFKIEDRLDWLEAELPALPAASLRFQRSVANEMQNSFCQALTATREASEVVASTAATALKTVLGTGRRAASDSAAVTRTGARRVAGQARAQAKISADEVADQASDLVAATGRAARDAMDTASDSVDAVRRTVERPHGRSGVPYEEWTKAELYERAQELDIDGRATMPKAELIRALRSAQ